MAEPGTNPVPGTLLSRVLDPTSPRAFRLAAARGALPLSRPEMVQALVGLIAGGDPELHSASTETLGKMTAESLIQILQDPGTAPDVLTYFADQAPSSTELLAAVITNPSTPDDTLEALAGSTDPQVLGVLVSNENRLAQSRSVVEKLKENPALPSAARRRLTELEEHLLADASGQEAAPISPVPEIPPESPLPEVTGVPAEEEGDGEEDSPAPMLEIPLSLEEESAEAYLKKTPLFKRIVTMSVSEKIQAAIKGNSEERSILIRDPARLVATSVLKSPKLNDNEIEAFAKLRTVNEEVLRIIGNKRDWIKSYAVVHALVRNSRTPIAVAMGLVKRLSTRDLKGLGLDKNVPEVIRRTAKRMFDQRSQPMNKPGKKK